MRVAAQIAPLYPISISICSSPGFSSTTAGKLWENYLPETGFSMPFDERGEMVGHIGIGMELVNSLWRKIETDERVDRMAQALSADGGLPAALAAS